VNKDLFKNLLTLHGFDYYESGDEISLICPLCSPHHHNRRTTLYVNSVTDRWICHRCEPRQAGGNLKGLLRLLGLPEQELETQPAKDWPWIWSPKKQEPELEQPVTLPAEFRRDWQSSMTGQTVWNYLRGRIPPDKLLQIGVGYCTIGKLAGCAVFPVVVNREMKFWQARKVAYNTEPKYIGHSSGRSKVLYGYDWLQDNTVILTEGIFDALNVTNGIGLLGKTITDGQIVLLAAKQIENVTVMLDGDAFSAAIRVGKDLRLKLWTLKKIEILRLPVGKDPGNSQIDDAVERIRL